MKLIINIFLTLVALGLAVWLFFIIRAPIIEKKEFKVKRQAIIEKLEHVKNAQFAYKELHKQFTDNWDSLIYAMKNEKFTIVKTIGDPNDTSIVVEYDTSYVPIADSIFPKGFPIDSLKYIPYTDDAVFDMQAGSINQRGVAVPIFQVTDSEPYNKKYIERGEQEPITLGSMSEVKYSGNWK